MFLQTFEGHSMAFFLFKGILSQESMANLNMAAGILNGTSKHN
jgi:hypothetical protein